MNAKSTYRNLLNFTAILLFVNLLPLKLVAGGQFLEFAEIEHCEFYACIDTEPGTEKSNEELKNEDEKDDDIRIYSSYIKFVAEKFSVRLRFFDALLSFQLLDIPTPPPKSR